MIRKFLLISCVFFIFYFSSTSAIKVTDPSTWTNQTIYSHNVSLFDILDSDSQFYFSYLKNHTSYLELGLEFYLRKVGHILMYSTLSVLLLINLMKFKFKYVFSWLLTFVIAFVDEANQFMMVGRSGRILDVILDSGAAFLLLTIVWLYATISLKKEAKISKT